MKECRRTVTAMTGGRGYPKNTVTIVTTVTFWEITRRRKED
ncbi:hypothetical protein [Acutalibacter sp. 1XD8-33]|nr:hypothetical protein [Acutalibacter sp. 1XD8-33]